MAPIIQLVNEQIQVVMNLSYSVYMYMYIFTVKTPVLAITETVKNIPVQTSVFKKNNYDERNQL